MIYVEIVMILIGLGAIIFSVRMVEADSRDTISEESKKETVEKIDMKQIQLQWEKKKKELQEYAEDFTERTVQEAEKQLNEISNDKMIGMNEYATQILDKMEKNHEEVVFLYDMLKEKQDEIKHLIQEADTMKAELRDEVTSLYQQNQDLIRDVRESLQEEIDRLELIRLATQEEEEQREKVEFWPELPEEREMEDLPEEPKQEEPEPFNHNDEVIALYEKGHSILEISKMLSIGQGEVKFVIDLYGS